MTEDIKTEEQEDAEASKYWDEAVAVRQDGKDAPAEEPKEPVEEAPEPAPEPKKPAETPDDVEPEEGEAADDTGEEEEEPEETTDPWDGVPETVRAEFNEYKTKAEKFEHEARSNRGRMGAMQKEINELSRKLEATQAKDQKAEPPQDPGDSIFDFAEWKQFEDDFGDVAKPQKAAMRRLFETLHSRLQDTDRVSQELRQFHDKQTLEEQAVTLEKERPGWRQYIDDNREDFDSFVEADDVAKELLEPNKELLTNAAKARALVDLFRLHMDSKTQKPASTEARPKPEPRPLTPKRKKQLESASTVPPRSHPAPGRRSDDLPDPDEYDASFRYFQELATR